MRLLLFTLFALLLACSVSEAKKWKGYGSHSHGRGGWGRPAPRPVYRGGWGGNRGGFGGRPRTTSLAGMRVLFIFLIVLLMICTVAETRRYHGHRAFRGGWGRRGWGGRRGGWGRGRGWRLRGQGFYRPRFGGFPYNQKKIGKFLVNMRIDRLLMSGFLMLISVSIGESNSSLLVGNNGAVFRRRFEVAHVDCRRLINGDEKYMKEIATERPALQTSHHGFSCEDVQNRILPPRNPDTGFPVLYVQLVYKDYDFLEDQLATNYAAENQYCYFVDKKSPPLFHDRIRNLAKCLPNIVVSKHTYNLTSSGHRHNEAHFDCMRMMRSRDWKYAVLLQNHDILLKTHSEMTEILKIYGGANDIMSMACPAERCTKWMKTNLRRLQLCSYSFTGEALSNCQKGDIRWGKGSIQSILSREAVDFIFDEISVYELIAAMNNIPYGADEQLYNSLQITPEIQLPGGFHHKCQDEEVQSLLRIVDWYPKLNMFEKAYIWFVKLLTGRDNGCGSGYVRNGVCIYGVEYLPMLAKTDHIIANKVLPSFDHAVTSCISELLFNRTQAATSVRRTTYERLNFGLVIGIKSTNIPCPGNANQTLHEMINTLSIDTFVLRQPNYNSSARYGMIILIPSRVQSIEERIKIRDLWASANRSRMLELEECKVFFVVGRSADPAIGNEAETYGDVLQVDIEETYRNLVYKLEVAYNWIRTRVESDFVAKIDDDTVAVVDRLYERLRRYNELNNGSSWFSCHAWHNGPPIRDSCHKWFVSVEDYPDSAYPPFCAGAAYAMNRQTFNKIVDTMKDHKVLEVEDVFFTGIVTSAFENGVVFRGEDTSQKYRESFICDNAGKPVQSIMTSHGQSHSERRQTNITAVYDQLQKPTSCD